MNLFTNAFNTLLYRPLFNILILLYTYLPGHDFGLAVILLTVLLRLVLYPIMNQTIRSQKALADIEPKIEEIKEKFKNDQEGQAQEIIKLYKEKKINPFGIMLPLLIQLPLLIAFFQVFSRGLGVELMTNLYSFVPNPGEINYSFLGLINLSQPNLFLAVAAGITLFFQLKKQNSKIKKKKGGKMDDMVRLSRATQKQMPYFFSAFSFAILLKTPAALGLYWIITSLFSIGQQYILEKHDDSNQP
jgi:YidC/Oxa1 family membrane protein insertase